MMADLEQAVADERIFEHCTVQGEGRRLINQKPMHGLYAYLWARVLLRKRTLTSLPLTYFWELEEGVHAVTGRQFNLRTPEAEQVLRWLDRKAEFLAGSVA
jgi:hypothetical protein